MKKIFKTMAFVLMATMAVVGCGSDDDPLPSPSLSVPKSNYNVAQNGETLKVILSTNQTNISVHVDENWIHPSLITPQSFSLIVDKNEELYERTASVIIEAGSLSETIYVTQQGGKILTLAKTEYTISDAGGDVYIDTESNFKYKVSTDAYWVQEVSNSSRAISKSRIVLNVLPNEDYDSREAKITLSDPSSDVIKTLTIIQTQKNAIVLAKDFYEIDKDGGEISFEVGANFDYEIKINDSWISQKTSRALSYKNLTFVVSPNQKPAERTTNISLINKDLDVVQMITIKQLAVSGTIGGHDYVDLGLPSGIKWATCNVGASTSTDRGNYYAWGETSAKETYTWNSYKWGEERRITKYFAYPSPIIGGVKWVSGTQDGRDTLEPSDDAAHVNWGAPWRMPTVTEYSELLKECTWTRTSRNIVAGYQIPEYIVTGYKITGPNGNSIFLPATGFYSPYYESPGGGYYWSSTLSISCPNEAYYLFLGTASHELINGHRHTGIPVRAVCP